MTSPNYYSTGPTNGWTHFHAFIVNGISIIPFSIGVFVFVLLVSQEETVKLLLQTAR